MFALFATLMLVTAIAPRQGQAPPSSSGERAPVAPNGRSATAAVASLTADEALVVQIVNEERRANGLQALQLDALLVQVAREHSSDMASRGYFGHLAPWPSPRTPLDRYAAALGRTPEEIVGENIGRADQPLMAVIHEQMMASPAHKANIVDTDYVRVGVGIYTAADGRVWVTEMFTGSGIRD